MDVFLIPFEPGRYELYCEQRLARDAPVTRPTGLVGRVRQRIDDLLRKAEQWESNDGDRPHGFFARLNDRAMAWVAERVNEQRLLWNLRRETAVTAVHPDDLTFEEAHAIVRRALQQDFDRHQYWVWVDGFLFALTFVALGPLFLLIPGIANLPALYFGFRAISHWYSRHGAQHGLRQVCWTGRVAAPLTELRQLPLLPSTARSRQLHDVAARLRLANLPSFYERVCGGSL